MRHPVTEIVLALADAGVPEEQIDFEAVAEARQICDQPLTDTEREDAIALLESFYEEDYPGQQKEVLDQISPPSKT